MEEDKIKNWPEIKPKLVQEFPELKEEELDDDGNEEKVLETLQEKLKQDKKDIRRWLRLMG